MEFKKKKKVVGCCFFFFLPRIDLEKAADVTAGRGGVVGERKSHIQ